MPLTITLTPGALPEDGDTITNATLRAIAQPTVDLEGDIGSASIADGSVTTPKLADGVLTADVTGRAKMEDGYVNAAKIEADAVTTAAILNDNVTAEKLEEDLVTDVVRYAAGTKSSSITLSSLTSATVGLTTTATATATAHGLSTGNVVTVTGATQTPYNGVFTITVTDADHFTYTMLRAASASPATGSPVADLNLYTVTLSPAPAAYATGMAIRFKTGSASTGAAAVNVNGLGAKALVSRDGLPLDLSQLGSGAMVEAYYDGTSFRTTLPSRWQSCLAPLSASGVILSFAHTLGAIPRVVRFVGRCVTSNLGYAVGDELELSNFASSTNEQVFGRMVNTTTVSITQSGLTPQLPSLDSAGGRTIGSQYNITSASWNVKVYCEL
jgi:hypothetical protein